jgi:3-hydroxyisobutyrate dehydrogenase-like beta-hydroxyacid dehydrogenase
VEAGYLGVGNMGQPMTHKALDGGHGDDLCRQRGGDAAAARTSGAEGCLAQDLTDRCEMVFVSMPTLAAFRKVPFGPDGLAKGRSMKLLVNTCTIGMPPRVRIHVPPPTNRSSR